MTKPNQWILISSLLVLWAASAWAVGPAPGPAAPAGGGAATMGPPAPGASSRGGDTKKKFQQSKLTYDESEESADRRNLLLTVGEDKTVDLDFDFNGGPNGVSIGNPKVVATTLAKLGEKRQIVFKPLADGESTVTLRDEDGTIRVIFNVRVSKSNLERLAGQIKELVKDIEGIDIKIIGQKIVIDGEVLVPTDYGRLVMVIGDKAYRDQVINLTTLSPLALQVLSKRIAEDVHAFAPNVSTRVVNGVIFLEGNVDSADKAARAVKIANLYLPDARPIEQIESDPRGAPQRITNRRLVENFIMVDAPPPKKTEKLVRVTVHFVELSKDYNKVFGFKWAPGFTPGSDQLTIGSTASGSTGTSQGTGASFSATLSSLFPKLNSAQAAGYARIIKSGTVIVRSGQPASLAENTQMPYTVQGPNGQVSSQMQNIGLTVGVTPFILGQSEDIQMELDMKQVSMVGRAPATGGAATTANHEVKTKIYVKSGESAAVAGVNSSDVGTDFNKDDPNSGSYSGNTSALFNLLHSKNYRKKKSQFVIFVTPQIIENASEGTEDLKRNFRVKVK